MEAATLKSRRGTEQLGREDKLHNGVVGPQTQQVGVTKRKGNQLHTPGSMESWDYIMCLLTAKLVSIPLN